MFRPVFTHLPYNGPPTAPSTSTDHPRATLPSYAAISLTSTQQPLLSPLLSTQQASMYPTLDAAVWATRTHGGTYTSKGNHDHLMRFRCKRTHRPAISSVPTLPAFVAMWCIACCSLPPHLTCVPRSTFPPSTMFHNFPCHFNFPPCLSCSTPSTFDVALPRYFTFSFSSLSSRCCLSPCFFLNSKCSPISPIPHF